MVKKLKGKKVKPASVITEKSSEKSIKYFSGKYFLILVLSVILIPIVILIWFISKRINVANVNGQHISRIEFYKELEKKDGNSVLDDLITKRIIFQEAKKRNIFVSASDIENELNKIRESVISQGSTLEEVLSYQGVTYNQLLENIKIQKILEVILKDNINVSGDEVKARYDQNKDIYGKDKTFDDLKEDIRFQIYQEKITAAYRTWIEEKRNSSIIKKYL